MQTEAGGWPTPPMSGNTLPLSTGTLEQLRFVASKRSPPGPRTGVLVVPAQGLHGESAQLQVRECGRDGSVVAQPEACGVCRSETVSRADDCGPRHRLASGVQNEWEDRVWHRGRGEGWGGGLVPMDMHTLSP